MDGQHECSAFPVANLFKFIHLLDLYNKYLSGLFPPEDTPDLADVSTKWWPADVHLIGVDIAKLHSLYWDGMLAAIGLEAPRKLLVHELFTKDGMKVGKSLGMGGGWKL